MKVKTQPEGRKGEQERLMLYMGRAEVGSGKYRGGKHGSLFGGEQNQCMMIYIEANVTVNPISLYIK